MTLIIKKGTHIYCANIGNILAFIFFSEKIFSYKFEVFQLNYDDSNFSLNHIEDTKKNNDIFLKNLLNVINTPKTNQNIINKDIKLVNSGTPKNKNEEISRDLTNLANRHCKLLHFQNYFLKISISRKILFTLQIRKECSL